MIRTLSGSSLYFCCLMLWSSAVLKYLGEGLRVREGEGEGEGEGVTPVGRVCARLQEVAASLQREYVLMDSEEEAQKLMDEVARGLERAQAGGAE